MDICNRKSIITMSLVGWIVVEGLKAAWASNSASSTAGDSWEQRLAIFNSKLMALPNIDFTVTLTAASGLRPTYRPHISH